MYGIKTNHYDSKIIGIYIKYNLYVQNKKEGRIKASNCK